MYMSEADLLELIASNPNVKIREQNQRLVKSREPAPTQCPTFDSQAEERFYDKRILPLTIAGYLYKLELHKIFEIKGGMIKKLQRNYPLCRQLFILKYCLPNDYKFIEVHDDEI